MTNKRRIALYVPVDTAALVKSLSPNLKRKLSYKDLDEIRAHYAPRDEQEASDAPAPSVALALLGAADAIIRLLNEREQLGGYLPCDDDVEIEVPIGLIRALRTESMRASALLTEPHPAGVEADTGGGV